MKLVTAVIVTYNSADVVCRCVRSLCPFANIVVVDNASTDGSADYVRRMFPEAHVIENTWNAGFAAAVNQGAHAANTPYLLICNPDIEVLGDITPMMAAAGKYGASSGRLVGPDGHTQSGFTIRRFPTATALIFEVLGLNAAWRSNPVNRSYRYLDRDLEQSGLVEQPAGAFLMVRADIFEKLGGFDERFAPVWFEDVDFCFRLYSAGHSIWYECSILARHTGAHSVAKVERGSRELYWYGNLMRYAEKYFPRPLFTVVCAAVAAGTVPRMIVGILRDRNGKALVIYGRVIRLVILNVISRGMPVVRQELSGGAQEGSSSVSPQAP